MRHELPDENGQALGDLGLYRWAGILERQNDQGRYSQPCRLPPPRPRPALRGPGNARWIGPPWRENHWGQVRVGAFPSQPSAAGAREQRFWVNCRPSGSYPETDFEYDFVAPQNCRVSTSYLDFTPLCQSANQRCGTSENFARE